MQVLLAILSGVAATGIGYLAGVFTTIFLLVPQPEPVQAPPPNAREIRSSQPVRIVSIVRHDLERMPDSPIPQFPSEAKADTEPSEAELISSAEPILDTRTTGSISDAAPVESAETELASNMSDAHVRWCSEQYRSYRPENNSYTSYSGASRQCESPYSDNASEFEEAGATFVQASIVTREERADDRLSSQHIQSCFDRYRSYRSEDNSYQPYGGGPRRQCH